jgi:integral membrane protein
MSITRTRAARWPLSPSIRQLRAIGFAEAVSYLLLLGVAMPLKYLAGMPLAVRYVGWAHGVLFMLYVGAVAAVAYTHRWRAGQTLKALVASVLPFGPFVLDREWREQEGA